MLIAVRLETSGNQPTGAQIPILGAQAWRHLQQLPRSLTDSSSIISRTPEGDEEQWFSEWNKAAVRVEKMSNSLENGMSRASEGFRTAFRVIEKHRQSLTPGGSPG